MRALIVEDGYSRGALAAARALGTAGWTVGVGAARRGLAGSSRWTSYRHSIPLAHLDPQGFIDRINRAAVRVGYDVVFGAGDAEILTLSETRDDLKVTVPYPPHDVVMKALDKLELARAAERAGLLTPRTVEATGGDVGDDFPVVVKARLHNPPGTVGGHGRIESIVVSSEHEARERVQKILDRGADPILQQHIAGRLMALVVLRDPEGKLAACVQQRADAIWPHSAGISVRARTVPVNEDLREGVAQLLDDLSWWGLAELQFVESPDGNAWLIDLNGRFYGSLALAVAAGGNIPTLWASLATGSPHESLGGDPVAGLRYQWLEGDLRRAFEERRRGLVRDVTDCLRYARGARHSIWSREDRWPAIRYVFELGWRGVRKALT